MNFNPIKNLEISVLRAKGLNFQFSSIFVKLYWGLPDMRIEFIEGEFLDVFLVPSHVILVLDDVLDGL